MKTLPYSERSRLLLNETLDMLRSKSCLSTFLERARLTAEAIELFKEEAQPLRVGHSLAYVLERASCPVSENDILLGRFPEVVPSEAEEALFDKYCDIRWENGFYTPDNGHTPLDWEELLRIGLDGYAEKCSASLQRHASEGEENEVLYLEGAAMVFSSFSRFISRYADAARDLGLTEAEAVCRHVSHKPPRSFREALQLVLMVTSIYSVYCVGGNATLCCGRMDDYLLPFYLRDLQNGTLTREDAGCLIDDFSCKIAMTLGRGEHQMSAENATGWMRNPAYDSPVYVILGGYSGSADHRVNPLTRLFAERIHPRLENPVFVFRRTADTDPELLRLVCGKMRDNASVLMYNDETMIPSFEFAGVEHDDAVNYTIHGCNWPDLQGLNTYSVVDFPLAVLIMESLFDKDGVPLRDIGTIDEIYAAVEARFRQTIRDGYAMHAAERQEPQVKYSLRVSDCFKRGIIEAGCSGYCSAKYPFIHSRMMHIGTAADILAALEDVVCGGKVSLRRLGEALAADFNGFDDVLRLCLAAPKYGHDDDRADRHGVRLMTALTDIAREEALDKVTGERLIYNPTVMITDMGHIDGGAELGATPDGRRAGAPFSENLSPTKGQSHAVTSLLNSVAKLPFDRISSGALNVRLSPSMISGEEGLSRLVALTETYFRQGGMQLQLSVTDTETLRAAQETPEDYRDLMVRITGYSAVFVDMTRRAQEEVITRDSLV